MMGKEANTVRRSISVLFTYLRCHVVIADILYLYVCSLRTRDSKSRFHLGTIHAHNMLRGVPNN